MILITDRRDMSQFLYEAIATVEPCMRLPLDGSTLRGEGHAIIVLDIDLDAAVSRKVAKAVLCRCSVAPTMPILCLSRHGGENTVRAATEIGVTAILPGSTSRSQILFTIRRLIEASLARDIAPPTAPGPFTMARMREAGTAFEDLIDASKHDRPLPMDALARGGDAIVAAVGGGRIASWIGIVQAYDNHLYQHCLLVGGLAAAFAIHLGVSPAGQRLIAQAALVHDLGKVKTPRHILDKPGRLTADEMDVVRRHPAIGHAMLVEQGGLDPRILDIVLHHHEYLDGSGYPGGLRGEAISHLVRLTTICDICAAMIERRSYKPARSMADAVAALRGMGGRLDAALVQAFANFAHSGSSKETLDRSWTDPIRPTQGDCT